MIPSWAGRPRVVLAVNVALQLAGAAPVFAQTAWTPAEGEATVSVAFQHIKFNGHFWGDGSKHEGDLPSRADAAIVQFEYGFTDKLALTAKLPYIASKFTATGSADEAEFFRQLAEAQHSTPGTEALQSLDTGSTYATFQDLGVTLRYNAVSKGLVLTPIVGVTIPSHDYRTAGEAAPGQKRLALQTGVNVGRLLDPVLPHAYVHAAYSYSLVQRLYGISLDRSSAEFEVGYAVTPLVGVRALASWGKSHGGLPFEDTQRDPILFLDHDRLLASRYWHVGGGTTIALMDTVDLDVAGVTFVAGGDTHYGWGVTVGVSKRFQLTARRPATVNPTAIQTPSPPAGRPRAR